LLPLSAVVLLLFLSLTLRLRLPLVLPFTPALVFLGAGCALPTASPCVNETALERAGWIPNPSALAQFVEHTRTVSSLS
jgi:hypothetical protein